MAKNTIINYTNAGRTKSATGTGSLQTIFTAGTNGTKIVGVYIYGAATTAFSVQLDVNDGSNQSMYSGTVTTDGNGFFDLMTVLGVPKTAAGTKYFNIEGTVTVRSQTSNSVVTVVYGEDY